MLNKKYFIFLALVAGFLLLFLTPSCKEKKSNEPCNGYGNIYFTNKTDSAVEIEVVEAENTFTLAKNHINCVPVEGDKQYKINIVGRKVSFDTTISIAICGKIDLIILK